MFWLRKSDKDVKGTVIEFDVGPEDILVLSVDEHLSDEIAQQIKAQVNGQLEKEGRQCWVLSKGMTLSVIHRNPWRNAA